MSGSPPRPIRMGSGNEGQVPMASLEGCAACGGRCSGGARRRVGRGRAGQAGRRAGVHAGGRGVRRAGRIGHPCHRRSSSRWGGAGAAGAAGAGREHVLRRWADLVAGATDRNRGPASGDPAPPPRQWVRVAACHRNRHPRQPGRADHHPRLRHPDQLSPPCPEASTGHLPTVAASGSRRRVDEEHGVDR
jgi:hypothetical protein